MGAGKGDAAGPLTTAAVVGALPGIAPAAAAIGAAPYMMVRGAQDQAKAGREQMAKTAEKQDELAAEAEERRKKKEAADTALIQRDQMRSRLSASSSNTRGGTILTSPLGVVGGSGSVGRSVIGS